MDRPELERARDELRARRPPNVVAVGIGYRYVGGRRTQEVGVVVGVRQKLPVARLAASDVVPRQVRGVPTDVIELGRVRPLRGGIVRQAMALPRVEQLAFTARVRPCPAGFSIGHPLVTAGTLGGWCKRVGDDRWHLLTNNHVGAAENAAQVGDPVLQPGPYDGGLVHRDRLATLATFIPIDWQGENLVDAAVAVVDRPEDVDPTVHQLGQVRGHVELQLGDTVTKAGRTTEVTRGTVVAIGMEVDVDFDGGRLPRFIDQVMIEPGRFSAGGDSGSLIMTADLRAGALLFAGGGGYTFATPIRHVMEALGVYFPAPEDDAPPPPPPPPPPPGKRSPLCRWLAAARIANRRLARRR